MLAILFFSIFIADPQIAHRFVIDFENYIDAVYVAWKRANLLDESSGTARTEGEGKYEGNGKGTDKGNGKEKVRRMVMTVFLMPFSIFFGMIGGLAAQFTARSEPDDVVRVFREVARFIDTFPQRLASVHDPNASSTPLQGGHQYITPSRSFYTPGSSSQIQLCPLATISEEQGHPAIQELPASHESQRCQGDHICPDILKKRLNLIEKKCQTLNRRLKIAKRDLDKWEVVCYSSSTSSSPTSPYPPPTSPQSNSPDPTYGPTYTSQNRSPANGTFPTFPCSNRTSQTSDESEFSTITTTGELSEDAFRSGNGGHVQALYYYNVPVTGFTSLASSPGSSLDSTYSCDSAGSYKEDEDEDEGEEEANTSPTDSLATQLSKDVKMGEN